MSNQKTIEIWNFQPNWRRSFNAMPENSRNTEDNHLDTRNFSIRIWDSAGIQKRAIFYSRISMQSRSASKLFKWWFGGIQTSHFLCAHLFASVRVQLVADLPILKFRTKQPVMIFVLENPLPSILRLIDPPPPKNSRIHQYLNAIQLQNNELRNKNFFPCYVSFYTNFWNLEPKW